MRPARRNELTRSAFRATAERHASAAVLPPVYATIANSPANGTLSLRIRDTGGGISPANMRNVFSYAFTTVASGDEDGSGEDDPDADSPYAAMSAIGGDGGAGALYSGLGQPSMQSALGSIAGQGFGLPLSRLYCQYFGGALELVSMPGHGADVYVVLGSLRDGDDPPVMAEEPQPAQ